MEIISLFGITTGTPPSITATQEFVVPKSIPITLLIVFPPKSALFYRLTPVSATETTVAHQI